jgi:SlyX protein
VIGGDDMGKQHISEEVDERFQVLENKVLYQDRTIEELNEVVTRQQDQIDLLTADLKRLRDLLESPPEDGIKGGEEPPPPHY